MLTRLKIATLLTLSVAFASLVSLIVATTAWVGLSSLEERLHEVATQALPNQRALAKLQTSQLDIARNLNALQIPRLSGDARKQSWDLVHAAMARFAEGRKEFEAIPSGQTVRAPWDEMKPLADAWIAALDTITGPLHERDQLVAGGADPADPRVKDAETRAWNAYLEARQRTRPLGEALGRVSAAVTAEADAQAATASADARRARVTLGLGVLLATILLWVALRIGLTRAILSTFSTIRAQLDRIAAGDMPPPIEESRGPDFNAIRDSLNRTTDTVKELLRELGRVSREHEAGEIDAAIDAARFAGDYRAVAEGVNAMVQQHVAVTRQAMGVVAELGRGNVEAPLAPLPGKLRSINETVEQVRGNLQGIIAEMGRMSAEHEKGEIDVVIDAARFQGAFRAMAEGINAMVGAHIAAKRQAMGVVAEFGRGNFEVPMPLLPGKKRFVNDTIEQVRANLKSLVADAAALAGAAVEGKLDVRADASRQPGDFRRIVQGVNDTLDAIIAPIRELTSVLDRLAAGDLRARTDPTRHQHESRRLLEGVNETLGALLAPVAEATEVLRALAEKDLRARMTRSYPGDHATMKEAVNATAQALEEALAQVSSVAAQVSGASAQIAASSQAVAAGASEQAASLTETTSRLEALSSIVRQAADSAQQANGLATAARGAAQEGTSAVDHLQAAMGKVRASSEATGQIIRDVSDIAFQTNLLALNAAVEAARAGEAGRGFAVVAEEVRSLALRAKEAATKTEELIRGSVMQAGEGEGAAKIVAGKLQDIAQGVSKVTDIVGEIAAAAREQSAGIEQLGTAVSEMDKVTQQNAASAEESSSAASELNAQSEELAAMVGSFRISTSPQTRPGRPRPPALGAAPRSRVPAAALPAPQGPLHAREARRIEG